MGEVDIENLHRVYRICVEYGKIIGIFHFKVDDGSFETALEFDENNVYHPPKSKNWSNNPVILCPDILDFEKKLIIEYEEESDAGKRMGKIGKKGHWEESKRDNRRDLLYKKHGFKILKIWESDDIIKTKDKIFRFLS